MKSLLLILCAAVSSRAVLADDWNIPLVYETGSQTTEKSSTVVPKTKEQLSAERKELLEKKLSLAVDRLTPDAKVRLVWFTADDCPYCVKWERGLREDTSQKRFARSDAARWSYMSIVRKRSLSVNFEERDFGDEIEFVKKARFINGGVKGVRVFPWFAVYVDQKSVMESSLWDRDILPALDKLWVRHQELLQPVK